MNNKTPKIKITREEIAQMKEVDIRTVDREALVDIKDVKINTELSDTERMIDFMQQIRNPYCYHRSVVRVRDCGDRFCQSYRISLVVHHQLGKKSRER